ncbi:MAG: DNA methyltransferase [Planctomycetota bacterium]|nr:DNA methyltransferase [Planctomycetota bacterium]
MKPIVQTYCARVEDVLPGLPSNTVDGVLTDPPYGIGFLNADWDHEVPPPSVWAEVCRVMKPGACLMAFSGTRTWHKLGLALEQGGLVIVDTLMWLYGKGFPKATNMALRIDKALGCSNRGKKFNVAGKHAPNGKVLPPPPPVGPYEARTPEGQPWLGYGNGLKPNWEPVILARKPLDGTYAQNAMKWGCGGLNIDGGRFGDGRYPGNVLIDEEAALLLDAQDAIRTGGQQKNGGPSRFFHAIKASPAERNAGLVLPNNHPTVKPIALAEYLARLILPTQRKTPRTLLVPFCGTFSEIIGAVRAGWDEVIGIEMDEKFYRAGQARLIRWCAA